jgi:hypothetical protein
MHANYQRSKTTDIKELIYEQALMEIVEQETSDECTTSMYEYFTQMRISFSWL